MPAGRQAGRKKASRDAGSLSRTTLWSGAASRRSRGAAARAACIRLQDRNNGELRGEEEAHASRIRPTGGRNPDTERGNGAIRRPCAAVQGAEEGRRDAHRVCQMRFPIARLRAVTGATPPEAGAGLSFRDLGKRRPPIDSAAACSSAAGLGKTKPGAGILNWQAGLQVVPLPMLRAARCAVN